MRTEKVTIYQFAELSDAAKEAAREWWRNSEIEMGLDVEFAYDDFTRVGDILGISFDQRSIRLMGGGTRGEPCIYYSGFSSQGDGACFEGYYSYAKGAPKAIRAYAPDDEELHAIADGLQALQRRNFYRLTAATKHRGHYYHSGCMSVDVEDSEHRYRDLADAEGDMTDLLRRFADWMYRQLESEYEWRMSDEQVDEAITANEYEFDEDGDRYC
jgi:hypothetical protein